MMLMAIDHVRDYVARSAMLFLPTDLTRTTAPVFLTRWITHFCAPVFLLTAGLGAFFWMTRGRHSKPQLSRFLITRGIWLIPLEITILRVALFSQVRYRGSVVILFILWAIGLGMIALAGLIYLPMRWLAVVSIAIIALHNLLGLFRAALRTWRMALGHPSSAKPIFFCGHQFRHCLPCAALDRRDGGGVLPRNCRPLGSRAAAAIPSSPRTRTLTAGFLLLRGIDLYGDPLPWTHQTSTLLTALSFLDTSKYPPSLDFRLMTLGPAFIALAFIERRQFSSTNPLLVFGRVPFFYYIAHLVLAHAVAIAMNFVRYGRRPFLLIAPPSMGSPSALFPADYGFPLWVVYVVWIAVLLVLYPACLWFSRIKQRRHDWWLSYL